MTSVCGPTKKPSTVDNPLALAAVDDHPGIERGQHRGDVGGIDRDAAAGVEQGMFAVDALGIIGEAFAAAGPKTGLAGAIIPAAGMLGDIAADGPGVADLRAGDLAGGLASRR